MMILGIDPGKTIGLCLYDDMSARVVASECVTAANLDAALHRYLPRAAVIAIERPRIYGIGGNDIADACEQFGWIVRRCGGVLPRKDHGGGVGTFGAVLALERRAVTDALSAAVGQQVRGDGGVWAALKQLHGDDCERAPQAAIEGRPYLPRIQRVTATKTRAAVQGQREQTAIEPRAAIPAGPLYGVTSHARQALAVAWAAGSRWLDFVPF